MVVAVTTAVARARGMGVGFRWYEDLVHKRGYPLPEAALWSHSGNDSSGAL